MRLPIPLLALLLAAPLAAQPPAGGLEPVPEPPPIPDPVESGEVLEPEVRIIVRDDARIEEYRINNQLYMVKVTPRRGAPYYLVDTTGDGRLDTRRHELEPDFVAPSWILFRW
jgi:hypothetical protein